MRHSGLKSDQVRRDAIKLCNTLTLKQVYDLAKVEESTKAQIGVITKVILQPMSML